MKTVNQLNLKSVYFAKLKSIYNFHLFCFYVFLIPNAGFGQILEWAGTLSGQGISRAFAVEIDVFGDIYVVGNFDDIVDFDPGQGTYMLDPGFYKSIFIWKLNTQGELLWVKKISSNTSFNDAQSIVSDDDGNIYVTGYFDGKADFDPGPDTSYLTAGTKWDAYVVKLDRSGEFYWAKKFGGFNDNNPSSIKLDNAGHVYVCGYFNAKGDYNPGPDTLNLVSTGNYDGFVFKLNENGGLIWAKNFGGKHNDFIRDISIDSTGNIYVIGHFTDTMDFAPDAGHYYLTSQGLEDVFVSKLDSSGQFLWAKRFGGNHVDQGYSLALDEYSNIYITGEFRETIIVETASETVEALSKGYSDIFVSKLSPNGDVDWFKDFGSSGTDWGKSIAVDSFGDIYVGGALYDTMEFETNTGIINLLSDDSWGVLIFKLANNGIGEWATNFNS
jgi:Beta-propeller repeat